MHWLYIRLTVKVVTYRKPCQEEFKFPPFVLTPYLSKQVGTGMGTWLMLIQGSWFHNVVLGLLHTKQLFWHDQSGVTTIYTYILRTFCMMQCCHFMPSSGRASCLNRPLSSDQLAMLPMK
jgi:hypothetical protein